MILLGPVVQLVWVGLGRYRESDRLEMAERLYSTAPRNALSWEVWLALGAVPLVVFGVTSARRLLLEAFDTAGLFPPLAAR